MTQALYFLGFCCCVALVVYSDDIVRWLEVRDDKDGEP